MYPVSSLCGSVPDGWKTKKKPSDSRVFELCGGLDLHVKAEVAQSLKEPLGHTFLVALDEVLIAEIVKFHAVAEHVVDVSEHGRGDREDGLLRAAAARVVFSHGAP